MPEGCVISVIPENSFFSYVSRHMLHAKISSMTGLVILFASKMCKSAGKGQKEINFLEEGKILVTDGAPI